MTLHSYDPQKAIQLAALNPASPVGKRVRFHLPGETQLSVAHADDCAYFRGHPHRSFVFRQAIGDEFGALATLAAAMEKHVDMPKLWVVVQNLGSGRHILTSVWRGKRTWSADTRDIKEYDKLPNDQELLSIWAVMTANNGMDHAAVAKAFKQVVANFIDPSINSGPVN